MAKVAVVARFGVGFYVVQAMTGAMVGFVLPWMHFFGMV